jgi:antitoxin (DNA-binding transcriptional repressor) of toxin-antitoxin stability system
MKSYEIRELRQSVSQILQEVKNGSVVEITELGETVARISPVQKSNWQDFINSGLVSPAQTSWHRKIKKYKIKGNRTTTDILRELRDKET